MRRASHSTCGFLIAGLALGAPAPAVAQNDPLALPQSPAPIAGADSVAPPATDFPAFAQAFLAQRLDSTRVASVSNLVLERDAGRFTLEQGELYLTTPVGGRVCAAVFMGRGRFALTPPAGVEREQLLRQYGAASLERPFRALVLLIADTTLAELERAARFGAGAGSKVGARALDECLRYVSERKRSAIGGSLAKPFLEGRANGYLFTLIEGVDGERLFFEIDPQRREEVTLWREPKEKRIGLQRLWRRDEVCMFPRAGSAEATLPGDARPLLLVQRQRIECHIAGDMDFAATAEVEIESRDTTPQHWASFTLYEKLEVDAVEWTGGAAARFFKGRDSGRLWVRCEPPLAPGETRTIRVRYHGPLIERAGDWMFLRSSIGWYPEPDGQHRVPFELTFHTPSQYHLVSVGERVSSETRNHVTTTRWRSERPIHNASFVLGLFKEESFGERDAPPVTALMFRGKPEPVQIVLGDVQVVSGSRMSRKVAADAARALAFFQRLLGPPPAARVTLAEIPDTGGEAFPGLIQITWSASWGINVAAEDAVFRAHEVAHQWWGYGVDYRTYHDRWLSEGFADFSGLWYLQQGLGDTKSYLAVLEEWRKQILEDLRDRPSGTPPAGPIWLGYRSASIDNPGDHALIVYKKGAWVLHMLRNMLLDVDTGNEDRFTGLMRDFYARHEGRPATTEDFMRIAGRYAGEDLGWFFDQWVYGTDLPTYRFASRTDRTAEGRYQVTCRVEQRGVPETFRMPVLIRVEFDKNRWASIRVMVQGPRTEVTLPLMEKAPTAVRFNDLESVLGRVEQVKW